jgi:hypothetical protein
MARHGVDGGVRAAQTQFFHFDEFRSAERDSLIVGEKRRFLFVPRSVEVFNRLRKVAARLRLRIFERR